MDRNTVIGVILIVLILVSSIFISRQFNPPPPAGKVITNKVDSARSKTGATASASDTIQKDTAHGKDTLSNIPSGWSNFGRGKEKYVTLENDLLKLRISTHGGRITYAELKKYKTYDKKPLILIDEKHSKYEYHFESGLGGKVDEVNTGDLYFNTKEDSIYVKGKDSGVVTMGIDLGGGRVMEQRYVLNGDDYMVSNTLVMNGMNKVIPKTISYLSLNWQEDVFRHENDSNVSNTNTTIHYRTEDDNHNYLSENGSKQESVTLRTNWVSFKEQFFCQALIAPSNFLNADLATTQMDDKAKVLKNMSAKLTVQFNHLDKERFNTQMYLGPLSYKGLSAYNLDLEKQIPLGWSFFLLAWINRFIIIPVFDFLSTFISNYGLIILILTIFIKLITLPFTYKSYHSTAKMRILKPELDEIKAKAGGDATKSQAETMKLYKKAGVSPFGGCIPMLLQFPILIAMFRFFPSSIELRQQGFLWAHDLSTYDSIYSLPFTIPAYGSHVSLFTILMTISTILYTRMNNSMTPQQAELKWMSYIMPIFFLGFFNNYAAGLSYYYFLSNVITFGQQYIFRKLIDEKKLSARIEENKKKTGNNVKKSKWQQRLEDIQKQQQLRQQQIRKR